jgi:uncharacterized protein HemY
LAGRRGDDIGKWNHDARAVLLDPARTAAEYRSVLQSATAALQAYPWSPALLTTLGTALYRDGKYREALETLERSESLRGYPDQTDLILIAMTHYRLGETEKARKEFQAAVPVRSHRADSQRAFQDEADALMAGGGH